MVYGVHLAYCFCCGARWMVGDCIPSVCDKCRDAGHNGGSITGCPICKPEFERMVSESKQRVEAAKLAKSNEFGAGIFDD